MAIRYIVRPSNIRQTPKALATKLEAEKVVQTSHLAQLFDPSRDVFLGYPPPLRVQGLSEGQAAAYRELYSFYCKDKYAQRKAIHEAGIKIPTTWGISPDGSFATRGGKFVIRPRHHMAGLGFEVVDNVSAFTSPNTHYLSRLFERQHEYRVIYSHGTRVCTLYKKMPEGVSQELAWTHEAGAVFQAINTRPETHRLHDRGAYAALEAFHVVKEAHVCAVDIAVSSDSYAVFEINFCPSLKIESRLDAVAARLKEVRV